MHSVIKLFGILYPSFTGLYFAYVILHENRITDRIQTAYDNVYYPIFVMIRNRVHLENRLEFLRESAVLLEQYEKYISPTTAKLFGALLEAVRSQSGEKYVLDRFCRHIVSENAKLRRKLGYARPGFLEWFEAMESEEQLSCAVVFYGAGILLSLAGSYVLALYDRTRWDFFEWSIVIWFALCVLILVSAFRFEWAIYRNQRNLNRKPKKMVRKEEPKSEKTETAPEKKAEQVNQENVDTKEPPKENQQKTAESEQEENAEEKEAGSQEQ